jgi:ABC-type sugar transport system permease subunit
MSNASTATTPRVGAAPRAGRAAEIGRVWRQSSAAYLLLAPFMILFVVILAYPLLYSLYLSFFDATLNQTPTFVGVQNFVRLFTDGEFLTSLRNTAYFTVFVVIGETYCHCSWPSS